MSNDIYERLREFLDTLPTGFPVTPTGVEIRILKKLFTPEEAELTMKLKNEPEEVSLIAARIGMEKSELTAKLEEMVMKGLIFRVRDAGRTFYQSYQFMVGIYEFQLKNLDKEFCKLFEEYLPYLGISLASLKTKQLRVIPVESAVNTLNSVAPYNQIKELVRQQELISVAECICRKEQKLLGNECDRPKETCLAFGDFARFYIDNQWARQINVEETMNILDLAEESGLVLSPTNTQKLEAICCCCPCCWPILKTVKLVNKSKYVTVSYYHAKIDSDLCLSCGLCVDRCQVDAIKDQDGCFEVLNEKCIGCGLCVSTCPEQAISLTEKPQMEPPPKDFRATLRKIETERLAIQHKS